MWIVLLPGKRRNAQGQILHKFSLPDWTLEHCSWSPDGKILLTLMEQQVLANLFKAAIFVLDDSRGRYAIKEIRNHVNQVLPRGYGQDQFSGERANKNILFV